MPFELVAALDLATVALRRSYGLTDAVVGEIFFIGDLLNLTDCLGDNCSLV